MPGRERGRSAQHDGAVRAAAMAVRREEAHVAQSEHGGYVADRGRLDVVEAEAVDVVERQPGIVERRVDRDARDLDLAHPELLGKLRLADPDDGGCAWSHGSVRLDAAG